MAFDPAFASTFVANIVKFEAVASGPMAPVVLALASALLEQVLGLQY